jgi:hypothetical protein
VVWNGKNQRGEPVAGGVYFYRLQFQTSGEILQQTRKMILIR